MNHSSNTLDIGLRATARGIAVNLLLVIVKGATGIFGNSYALIADAIESLADVLTSIIVWFGLRFSVKAPDDDHPYGHGKAEPLATIIVAFSLVIAAVIIAFESIHLIQTPHALPKFYTLFILLAVVIGKEWLFRNVKKAGKASRSQAVVADAWHHRADAMTSLTAMIGISIALIGGKGWESADDWAALLSAGLIIFNAWQIFLPAFKEIMDTAPSAEFVAEIKSIALTVPDVLGLDKCHVRKMGIHYYVDLHVLVNENLNVRQGHDIAHRVKDTIRAAKPEIYDVLVHIEPMDMD